MSDAIIQVSNLKKRYRAGGVASRRSYGTLREAISGAFSRSERSKSKKGGEFWALGGVSFEVKQGEVVGIIGRNGAGKSTLLKVLSRITEPTEGYADIYGRVAALLEVGTGFHPELSGRENIFLNGAILGMRKAEIESKFDEIVAFAEVEKFIDTPVKHYSSGMGLRLGFAVAAHLEPEILVVDEVLAVGDASFQQKCIGKMGDVAKQGRTVLFVSHNMAAVEHLCTRAIMLESGKVTFDSTPSEVIRHYLTGVRSSSSHALADRVDREGNGALKFIGLDARSDDGESLDVVRCGMDVVFALPYRTDGEKPAAVNVTLGFYDEYNRSLVRCWSQTVAPDFDSLPAEGELRCHIPRLPLMPGFYSVMVACEVNGQLADKLMDAISLQVIEGNFYQTGKLPDTGTAYLLSDYEWSSEANNSGAAAPRS